MCVYMYVCLYLSICLYTYLSIHLSTYLSVYLSTFVCTYLTTLDHAYLLNYTPVFFSFFYLGENTVFLYLQENPDRSSALKIYKKIIRNAQAH